jgi:hypothetical protein
MKKIFPGDLVISTSLIWIYSDVKLYHMKYENSDLGVFLRHSNTIFPNIIFHVISVVDSSLFIINELNSGWIHKNGVDIL